MARPTKEPTEEQRRYIETLAGYGLSQAQIGHVMGMDPKTLVKHCTEELTVGKAKMYAQAVNALFRNIKNGKEASLIFYLKTQHGWKETSRTEITGPDGVPLNQAVDAPPQETREQWIERISKEKALRLATSTGPAS